MRGRLSLCLPPGPTMAVLACTLLGAPATAGAVVSDVQPIDGPSADVIDVADVAMSEDGSGGIVYLKEVDKRDHVFAVQSRDGAWGAPQRVDVGQSFDSSWARIGAGDGGRLVVTWVQEFGVESDRMFSATLDPGATGFQPPVPIDFNVGEARFTYPDLAMNRGGQGLPRLPGRHRHQSFEPGGLCRRRPAHRPLQRPTLVGAGHAPRSEYRHARA